MEHQEIERLPKRESWQEQALRVKAIHDKLCKTRMKNTIKDTATYVGRSLGWTSEQLMLAVYAEKDEYLGLTREEALARIKTKEARL